MIKKQTALAFILVLGSCYMASGADFPGYSENKERRVALVDGVKDKYSDAQSGAVLLFAQFEGEERFKQDPSFYYFTGSEEPGAVALLHFNGQHTVFAPNCGQEREKWLKTEVPLKSLGFDDVQMLGDKCPRFQIHPFSPREQYKNLIGALQTIVASNGIIASTCPDTPADYVTQRQLLNRFKEWVPGLVGQLVDCSPMIAQLRQKKSNSEIERIYNAIRITNEAQSAVARAIVNGANEAEVQASLEYIMTANNAPMAFPSVVGSGPNSTVLHYGQNNRDMKNGDLVVVDIGASYKHYAADITRTYPVSGKFTDRQKEIYTIVLETQEYIASIAQPGYYLRNNDHQDKSLHHLAIAFLKERGYDKYMPHGLGHYMGLDVHDVGDYGTPLKSGDVFTIEPGIYIAAEELGIRIEDDYWMTEKGAICLSEDIPKSIKDIEAMVKQKFE